jgi:L-ribulokinase
LKPKIYKPNPKGARGLSGIVSALQELHDAFGTKDWNGNLFGVMKQLIEIRAAVRK